MELTAISLSCGRLGLCLTSLSVTLDPTFFSSKNASEAASRLTIKANSFEILKDSYYVNVRPKAEVLARLLQTHLGHELQQLQQSCAAEMLVVIPSYPTTGSDEQASGIAINSAKADAMDAALQQLNIPGSCITRQSTRCISGAVKAWLGQDTRALAAGSWKQRQQLERDAAEVFLQEGRRCSVTAEVLHQFMVQDGRKSADARHDLAVVFWLAAAALMQRAEQLRLQRRGEQSQVKKQQQAAAKQRTAAKKQQQAGRKRANTGGLSSPAYGVLSTPMLPAAAVAAAGWAAAQASAEPPGAPVKKRRRVKVDPDADCIVLDD